MGARCKLCQPRTQTGRLLLSKLQNCACALHEQSSQIAVPAFADAKQFLFAFGGVFAPHQPHPGGELPTLTKGRAVTDRRFERSCNKWYMAGDLIQAATDFALL